jgi:hypothetical protein
LRNISVLIIIIRVRYINESDVSRNISAPHFFIIILMKRTEMFLETSVSFIYLTRMMMMMMRTEIVLETSVSFVHLT